MISTIAKAVDAIHALSSVCMGHSSRSMSKDHCFVLWNLSVDTENRHEREI